MEEEILAQSVKNHVQSSTAVSITLLTGLVFAVFCSFSFFYSSFPLLRAEIHSFSHYETDLKFYELRFHFSAIPLVRSPFCIPMDTYEFEWWVGGWLTHLCQQQPSKRPVNCFCNSRAVGGEFNYWTDSNRFSPVYLGNWGKLLWGSAHFLLNLGKCRRNEKRLSGEKKIQRELPFSALCYIFVLKQRQDEKLVQLQRPVWAFHIRGDRMWQINNCSAI